jgi:hypothetical protein
MIRKNTMKIGRFEVLKGVTMKKTISWDIMLCSLLGVHQYFGETYCSHLQGRTVSQARSRQRQSWFLAWLTFQSQIEAVHTPETSMSSTGLHGIMYCDVHAVGQQSTVETLVYNHC